jgi:hypothetical protein
MKKLSEITSVELMILVWPIIMSVVCGWSVVGVVVPKINEIVNINAKRIAVDVVTKQNIEKRNYLLSVDQTEIQKYANLLQESIIREKDTYFLVNVIRKILDKYNFQIQSFLISPGEIKQEDVQAGTKTNQVKKIPITLSIFGPREKYMDMILKIEHSLPILSLDKIEMSSTGELVNIDMLVSSYYLPTKSDINVDNLTLTDLTLKKDEQDLFSKLATFDQVTISQSSNGAGEFVKYERTDPFSF